MVTCRHLLVRESIVYLISTTLLKAINDFTLKKQVTQ